MFCFYSSVIQAARLSLSSICQATAEANNLTAVAGAKDMYSKNMETVKTRVLKIKDVRVSLGCCHF